jgi:hypothetical protein
LIFNALEIEKHLDFSFLSDRNSVTCREVLNFVKEGYFYCSKTSSYFSYLCRSVHTLLKHLKITLPFTGSLALTRLRKVVARLWSQLREAKQSVTILPASLGLNRSLLSNYCGIQY